MVERKSEGLTILLAVLPSLIGIFGIGHFYVGKIGWGIAFLIGGFSATSVSVLLAISSCTGALSRQPATLKDFIITTLFLVYWLWHIFDARAACRKHNLQLMGGFYNASEQQPH